MIKTAYTARELAEMKLPGFPETRENMTRLATRCAWDSSPRQGAGGGREFMFATLPPALQQAIMAHHAKGAAPAAGPLAAPEKQEDKRFLARAAIVTEFRAYCRRHALRQGAAEVGFVALYNAQRDSGAAEPFPRWLFDVYQSFSIASLRLWRTKQPQELKDGYGNRKGQSILARANGGEVALAIEAIICERQLLSAGHIRDLIRFDFGTELQLDGRAVPLPKIRAFERYIQGWKEANPEKYERAVNPDGWRNKYMLAVGKADGQIVRLNQMWEIDASPMDVLCKDGRYLIYALIDVWSRRIMIHVSRTATTEGSLQLIRRACREWGMPETLRTDNGSDFTSFRFTEAILHLGIETVVSGPFQPWKKAYVERVIGTFQHNFAPTMPGFIGHSVADRKKIEGVKSFADNLGADKEARFSVDLTHEELQAHINTWVDGHYHQQPHSGIAGMTPFARAASSTIKPRMVADIRALDILLAPVAGVRTVGKKGIRVEGAPFWHDHLVLHMGKDVYVRHDPDDMGRIYVFDTDHKFICEAINFDRLGAGRAAAAATAKAAQRAHLKDAMADARRLAKREYSPGKVSEKFLSDQARAASRVKAFPKQTETYTTPSIDEAARAGRKERIPLERTAQDKALQEAIVKGLAELQQRPTTPIRDQDNWWSKAKALEARVAAGEQLTEEETENLQNAQSSIWYRVRTEAEEMKKSALEGA